MKSKLDFYDTPTISRNRKHVPILRISYCFDNLIFENKSCKIVGVEYYKQQIRFQKMYLSRGNNKDCYQGSTLNSPLMEIENFDPNKTGFFA